MKTRLTDIARTSLLGWLLMAFVLSGGCGGDSGNGDGNGDNGNGGGPPTANMQVQGRVQGIASQGQAVDLGNARVEVRIDRDSDGAISNQERYETQADATGSYQIDIAGAAGRNLVVTFRFASYVSQHKTVRLQEIADVEVNGALRRTESLECQASVCSTEDQSLQVSNIPDNVTVQGRTFNPVVDTDAFPGEFKDDSDNLLVSGVFADIDVRTPQGDELGELDEPAQLRMRFPRDTWSTIRDIEPNNEQIDVPLYSFDENTGEWTRDGRAVIVDEDDVVVPEDDLVEIQTGSFSGAVYALGEVTHFSYWNVDWPIETHGSLTGTIASGGSNGNDGEPADGAVVEGSGVTYTGRSSPQTIGADGRFCIDVMRSEEPNEDIDGNGQSGDTHRVALRVQYQGVLYDIGTYDMATSQSSCEEPGSSTDIGTIDLTPERELEVEICELSIVAVDVEGEPLSNAFVWAWDYSVPGETLQSLCFDSSSEVDCDFNGRTDASGELDLRLPVIDRINLFGTVSGVNPEAISSTRTGSGSVLGCPASPVTVRFDQGYDIFDLEVDVDGDQISWEPSLPAAWVVVGGDQTKWWIVAFDEPIESPVTYGEVPDGARLFFPINGGEIDPLQSGDRIQVRAAGSSENGILQLYSGLVTVP